jgi:membrane-associated phospholipid phosphatase
MARRVEGESTTRTNFPAVGAPSLTYRNRWLCFGAVFVYAWILYFASNHQTLVPARFLPLTAVDTRTPFLPWTGWIYAAVFVMPVFACLAARTDADVRALVFSFAGMITLDTIVFIAYPTVYPRPVFRFVSWTGFPLALVRLGDTPLNCFPSQHVSVAFLTAFYLRRFSKSWGTPCLLLAIAIAISTLTTKQHYFWDVIAGALAAGAAYRLAAPPRAATGQFAAEPPPK